MIVSSGGGATPVVSVGVRWRVVRRVLPAGLPGARRSSPDPTESGAVKKPDDSNKPGEGGSAAERGPDGGKKPGESPEKKDGAKGETPAGGSTKRPADPPQAPDPKELEARPDAEGRVRFNFTGQPWPGVLQWLADISAMSLDWQELPDGYLNLTTQRSYTLEEARDLINRHLLAALHDAHQGEVISIFKIEKSIRDGAAKAPGQPRGCPRVVGVVCPRLAAGLETVGSETGLSPNSKLTALGRPTGGGDGCRDESQQVTPAHGEQSDSGQERLVRSRAEEHQGQGG